VHFYYISGLSVSSEIALPGVIGASGDRGRADVTIRRRPVPATLENVSASRRNWQIAGKQFLLNVPKVARFLVTDGQEIAFEAERGGDDADIPLFILGRVFGILLHQRERIALHASAVRVNGKAILFCGSSGAGKSTLAAALAQRGYPLVTDDFCTLTADGSGLPIVHPNGRQLKLWAQAIEQLDLAQRRGERVRASLEKFYVEPSEVITEPLALGAVYALREARPPHRPGIERLKAADAAAVLRQSAYRPKLLKPMGQKTNYFHAAAIVANKAGIFYLTRSLDFAAMPEVVSWLERHWLDIGV
jgi:hypothetical protein